MKLHMPLSALLSIRNIQFSRLLKANGQLREFNFTKFNPEGEMIFSIDVTDERSNRIQFFVRKENDQWTIQTKLLPEWIINNEGNFHEIIESELKYAS